MKLLITLIAVVMVLGFLLWEYFHGGVASHHLLHSEDLPKISNWWSLFSIPTITWLSLSVIKKSGKKNVHRVETVSKIETYPFLGGVLLGVGITILFHHAPEFTDYLLFSTFIFALFTPLYRPEFYLGFVLSMLYGFGGILPGLFGLVLMAIYAIEYCVIRKTILFVLAKTQT